MMPASFIEIIDTQQFGLPRTGAIYLVRGASLALVESGTAISAGRTLTKLEELAVAPRFILLTHIHLDHAGGAGYLARQFPQVKIVAHERAIRHLIDPRQLVNGVRLAAPDLYHHYGEPLPIPEHQLVFVTGGEVFDLGSDVQIEVIAAPGHAPHHICFYERTSRTLFTGDAAGNWSNPVDVPLTVPPRFDLVRGLVLTSDNNRLYLLWRNGGTNSQRNTKTSHERPDYTDRRNGVLEKIRNSEREDGTAHMAIRLCLSRRRTRTYTGRY